MKQTSKRIKRKYPKLRGQVAALSKKFIAEEFRTGRPPKQAVAIGISRARQSAKMSELDKIISKYL